MATTNISLRENLPRGIAEGSYHPQFAAVAERFVANFRVDEEVGAAVAVYLDNQLVVDLWGGLADPESSIPWTAKTLSPVHSSSKAAAAICAHVLCDRGLLDLDSPVGRYWPEYACNGKETTTVRMVLDHSAGVPALREPVKPDCLFDPDYMVDRIAKERPFWTPGERAGYHGYLWGFMVGELVRRVTGHRLAEFFQEDIAAPLGLEFWIGLPEIHEARVAKMIWPAGVSSTSPSSVAAAAGSIINLMLTNSGERGDSNDRRFHAAEIPSSNGITNALSLAALYAPLATTGSFNGVRLLRPAWTDRLGEISVATHIDASMNVPARWGLGFSFSSDHRGRAPGSNGQIFGRRAFGQGGRGGSIGFADPEARMSFGYVMNKMGKEPSLNSRGQGLIDEAYRSLGYRSNAAGYWSKLPGQSAPG